MILVAPTYAPAMSGSNQPRMSSLSQPQMGPAIRLGKVSPTHFGPHTPLRDPAIKTLNTVPIPPPMPAPLVPTDKPKSPKAEPLLQAPRVDTYEGPRL